MSDLTPNHTAGEPLEAIDKDKLASLRQKNIDNPEGGKKVIKTHTELMATSVITLKFVI